MKNLQNKKIAIVADWLSPRGGAEKVVLNFAENFPAAPIFTTIFEKENFPEIPPPRVKTSFLQKFPKFLRRKYRALFSLFPAAIESFNFENFDAVFASSIFVSKSILQNSRAKIFVYFHSPARFLWEKNFLKNFPLPRFLKNFLQKKFSNLRIWDFISARRGDFFIANSQFTAAKIYKNFRIKCDLILPPPVDFTFFSRGNFKKENFFLAVGRLVSQKNWEILIETFRQFPSKNLKIIGDGNLKNKLKKLAADAKNIEFLGFVENEKLRENYATARAIIFPQKEDAGIVPLESLSAGTPIVALRAGGAAENLNEKVAVFFENQNCESLKNAILKFEKMKFEKEILQNFARKFDEKNFAKKIKKFVAEKFHD